MRRIQKRAAQRLTKPANIDEAFQQGWKIVEDLSSWSVTNSRTKREGFLIFRKTGRGKLRLQIPFTALYDCGRPYFFPSDDVE